MLSTMFTYLLTYFQLCLNAEWLLPHLMDCPNRLCPISWTVQTASAPSQELFVQLTTAPSHRLAKWLSHLMDRAFCKTIVTAILFFHKYMHKMTFSLQTLNAQVKGVNSSYLPENRHWDSHDLTPISRLWKKQKENKKKKKNRMWINTRKINMTTVHL